MTKITFLGTGTSTGVPELGCDCSICTSPNPRDKRLRTSVLINHEGKTILIDCGPDFRQQMIRCQTNHLDAVLITHEHYDHVAGLDDLRPFCKQGKLPIYAESTVSEKLHQRMPYCFRDVNYPGVPNLELIKIENRPFHIGETEIIPIRVLHGRLPILGYRIGNMAFLTDLTEIPAEEYEKLKNLDVLIMAALRKRKHISHQTLDEAISQIDCIQPKKAYLIHASHHLGLHDDIMRELPESIMLSYDGLEIEI